MVVRPWDTNIAVTNVFLVNTALRGCHQVDECYRAYFHAVPRNGAGLPCQVICVRLRMYPSNASCDVVIVVVDKALLARERLS